MGWVSRLNGLVGGTASGWESESSVSERMLESERQREDNWMDWRENLSVWASMSIPVDRIEDVVSLLYLSSVRLGAGGGLQGRYSTQYGKEGCSTRVSSRLLPILPLLLFSSPSSSSQSTSAAASFDPRVRGEPAWTLRRLGQRCAECPRRPGAAVRHHEAPQQGGSASPARAGRAAAGAAVLARPPGPGAPWVPRAPGGCLSAPPRAGPHAPSGAPRLPRSR